MPMPVGLPAIRTSLIGCGWYTDMGYTNAVIECVPQAPAHGTITLRVKVQNASQYLNVDLDKSHVIPAVGAWPAQAANTPARPSSCWSGASRAASCSKVGLAFPITWRLRAAFSLISAPV